MGKESSLRKSSVEGNRREHANGDRKLFDKDAPPTGVNEEVWDLGILFEKELVAFGITGSARLPILYTMIYHAIHENFPGNPLTNAVSSGTHTYHSTGGPGIPGVTHIVVNSGSSYKVIAAYSDMCIEEVVDTMSCCIHSYFSNYYSDIPPSVDDFYRGFSNTAAIVLKNNYYTYLKTNGTRTEQTGLSIYSATRKVSREKVLEPLDNEPWEVYSESQMQEVMGKWRREHQ